MSRKPSPYAVRCDNEHGLVYLTKQEYTYQMSYADAFWKCPICGNTAEWDDDNYEAWIGAQPEPPDVDMGYDGDGI